MDEGVDKGILPFTVPVGFGAIWEDFRIIQKDGKFVWEVQVLNHTKFWNVIGGWGWGVAQEPLIFSFSL